VQFVREETVCSLVAVVLAGPEIREAWARRRVRQMSNADLLAFAEVVGVPGLPGENDPGLRRWLFTGRYERTEDLARLLKEFEREMRRTLYDAVSPLPSETELLRFLEGEAHVDHKHPPNVVLLTHLRATADRRLSDGVRRYAAARTLTGPSDRVTTREQREHFERLLRGELVY